jgi:hypothetical protein
MSANGLYGIEFVVSALQIRRFKAFQGAFLILLYGTGFIVAMNYITLVIGWDLRPPVS